MSDTERKQLKENLMAYDEANGLEANSAPASYGRLAATLHKCAKDYHDNQQKLSPEHQAALRKLMELLAMSDNPPEEQEEEPTEDLVDEPGPNDLPGGGMPLPGGGHTPLKRDNPIAQDLAFDEAWPEVARIKNVPSYGTPVRQRSREPGLAPSEEAAFARMFPEVARLGR
jgi:hypothetical protein